jgi:hypothetical protein
MFHIFVALPDLYIVLFHIIKTYSSFWINDIYGIYIEFVILPPISKKLSGLVALEVQIRVWQSFQVGLLQFICHGYVVSRGHFFSEVKHKYNYGIFLRPTICLSLMYLSESIICQGITVFIFRCTQKVLNITIFLMSNNIYQDCFKSNL